MEPVPYLPGLNEFCSGKRLNCPRKKQKNMKNIRGNEPNLSGKAPVTYDKSHFEVRELITLGIFSAVIKGSTILVALMGGGMNPVTLFLKNLIFTTLMIVMLHKVRKTGTILLFILVNAIVSALVMGGGITLIPGMLAAGALSEASVRIFGGYRKTAGLIAGVAVYDISFKLLSLGMSWVFSREQPQMLYMASVMVAIGYTGSLAGLFTGTGFVKELRHASIIRE